MAYTNLNNEIFAQASLEAFVKTLLPLNAFSRNYAPTPVQKGDTVLVPLIAALTATTFSTYAITGGEKTVVTVTINRHKVVPVAQTDLQAANSSEASLIDFAHQQGSSLAICVMQDIFSLITTASTSFATANATAVSNTDFGLSQFREARLKLNQSNVPMNPRSLILDCVPYDGLLSVTNFVQAHMFGNARAIQEGQIPRALGFNIYETNGLFPTTTWSVMGFAAHASAIAIAMRYLQPQPGNTYLDARPVSDPESGAVMGLRDFYDNATGTRYTVLEANYGYSVGITYAGRVINSAN